MTTKTRKPIGSLNERFVKRLVELSKGKDVAITNKTLQHSLKWPSEKYERVKKSLLAQGMIRPAPGYGGSVRVAKSSPTTLTKKPLNVFISYSHVDTAIKDELVKHLYPLEKLNFVKNWDDRKINPGEEWGNQISEKLSQADIVLLIISIDFINSKYCYEKELMHAMARHESGDATVIPVIARQCMWKHAPFGKLQALPKEAKAVTTWDDRDNALTSVAEGVYNIAKDRLGIDSN